MRPVVWAPRAQTALLAFLEDLAVRDLSLPFRAGADVDRALEMLRQRPYLARPARWPGYREWSVLKWRKIIVLKETDEALQVVGFFDARQDLPSAVE